MRLPPQLRPLFPYLKPAYVRATRLLAPESILLSRLKGGYLPTGVVNTLEEAADIGGGTFVTARAPEVIVRPPHLGRPADLAPLEPAVDTHVERVGAIELPGGRVLGPHRAVITRTGDVVQELSRYFGTHHPKEHPMFLNPFPGPPFEVPGRLGLLASRGDGNYYHFLIDVLPRIGVLELTPEIAMPDRWYVPALTTFQRQLLDMMGIGPERRIDSHVHPHVRAECLVVPGLPATTEKNPPWVVEFLRARLLTGADVEVPRRPLYVTRSAGTHNRAVLNESAVIELLTKRGFETVDPSLLSVPEQIRAFASASVIVAPHGAALANVIFASPGATVIELFPAGCVLPDYWRLASSTPGVAYRYLSAFSDAPRLDRARAIISDIEVDLTALTLTLEEVSA